MFQLYFIFLQQETNKPQEISNIFNTHQVATEVSDLSNKFDRNYEIIYSRIKTLERDLEEERKENYLYKQNQYNFTKPKDTGFFLHGAIASQICSIDDNNKFIDNFFDIGLDYRVKLIDTLTNDLIIKPTIQLAVGTFFSVETGIDCIFNWKRNIGINFGVYYRQGLVESARVNCHIGLCKDISPSAKVEFLLGQTTLLNTKPRKISIASTILEELGLSSVIATINSLKKDINNIQSIIPKIQQVKEYFEYARKTLNDTVNDEEVAQAIRQFLKFTKSKVLENKPLSDNIDEVSTSLKTLQNKLADTLKWTKVNEWINVFSLAKRVFTVDDYIDRLLNEPTELLQFIQEIRNSIPNKKIILDTLDTLGSFPEIVNNLDRWVEQQKNKFKTQIGDLSVSITDYVSNLPTIGVNIKRQIENAEADRYTWKLRFAISLQ